MLMIRLKRVGRKHDPSFRVVVTEKFRGPKAGKYIEKVGFYDAKSNTRDLDAERIKYWMSVGAQPSDTVFNLLVTEKIVDGKKKNVLPKKSPIIDEEKLKAEAEAKEAKEKAEQAKAEEAAVTEEPKAEEAEEATPADETPQEEPQEEAPAEETEDKE